MIVTDTFLWWDSENTWFKYWFGKTFLSNFFSLSIAVNFILTNIRSNWSLVGGGNLCFEIVLDLQKSCKLRKDSYNEFLYTIYPPCEAVVQLLCQTLCSRMDCSMPGFPVLHHLLEFAQTRCPLSQWCHPTTSSSLAASSSWPFSYSSS